MSLPDASQYRRHPNRPTAVGVAHVEPERDLSDCWVAVDPHDAYRLGASDR